MFIIFTNKSINFDNTALLRPGIFAGRPTTLTSVALQYLQTFPVMIPTYLQSMPLLSSTALISRVGGD